MNEKEFASEVFKQTRAMNRIAQAFFSGAISAVIFGAEFGVAISKMVKLFGDYGLSKKKGR